MYGLLAGLSVWMAGITSQTQGVDLRPAEALVQNELPSATTRIAARPIKVQVQVYRNYFPIIGTGANTAGSMMAWVRVSTTDKRGLPVISSVRTSVINSRLQSWTSDALPVWTLLFDPKSTMYTASGGPGWAVDSPVTVRVTLRSGSKTTTVNVPARIGVVR